MAVRIPLASKAARDSIGAVFHAREDQHHVEARLAQQVNQQRGLQMLRHFIDELGDGLRGISAAANLHGLGRAQKLVRDRFDFPRKVAEKSRVWRCRGKA